MYEVFGKMNYFLRGEREEISVPLSQMEHFDRALQMSILKKRVEALLFA